MSRSLRPSLALLGLAFLCAAPARAADIDRLLPDDTEMVLTVNVRQILDAAVVKKYVLPDAEKKVDSEVQKIVRVLGLNPVKEITSITFALPGGTDPNRMLAVINGSFAPDKLQAAANQLVQSRPDTLAVQEQDGVRVYESLAKDGPKGLPRFFALLDRNVLVAAPNPDYMAEAIAKSRGKRPSKVNAGLRTLIGKQDARQSLWLAAVTSDEARQQLAKNFPGLKDFASKLQSVSGGLTLTDDVKVNFRVQTGDAVAARAVRQQLEAGKALVILAVSLDQNMKDYGPTIIDVLNSIRFAQDQGTLGLELTISGNLIENTINIKPKPAKPQP